MGTGLLVAIIAGIIIGKLKLEKWVEEYVYKIKSLGQCGDSEQTFKERSCMPARILRTSSRGYGPMSSSPSVSVDLSTDMCLRILVRYAGPQNPLGVPLAVALGVPLYSNAAGVIPIVYALWRRG